MRNERSIGVDDIEMPIADRPPPQSSKPALEAELSRLAYLQSLLLALSLCEHFGLSVNVGLLIENVILRCKETNNGGKSKQVCSH